MPKIIGAIAITVIGILLFDHGMGMKSYESNRGGFIFFGALAQFGAGILLLYGFREFFLADILSELKILSVRASSRERYSPDSSSDETK